MKLDLVRRDAVNLSLGPGQQRERFLGQFRRARGQTCFFDQLAHDPVWPMRVFLGRRLYEEMRCLNSVHFAPGLNEREAAQPEACDDVGIEFGAEVEQGRDQHVAGDAADRIEHQRLHLRALCDWRAINAAVNPAEKPLSMFTTETLAAQELSIASSAARPPNEAP